MRDRIGQRLRWWRMVKGLSRDALARQAGVSVSEIIEYERDRKEPKFTTLSKLATAMGVREEFFFRGEIPKFEPLGHRKLHRRGLSRGTKAKVIGHAIEQVERWAMLARLTPSTWSISSGLPAYQSEPVRDMDHVEAVSLRIREAWSLGLDPISSVTCTLESNGIRVVSMEVDDTGFDGLCGMVGKQPVIVIGTHWPGHRQRFTLAHELAHLVFRGRALGELDQGRACDRFAGAFLMPESKVREALGNKRNSLAFYELYLLKHEFGLSISAWLHRALESQVISTEEYGRLRSIVQRRGWDYVEPGNPYPPESPSLFETTVHQIFWEDLITESKAAELMQMSQWDLAAVERMES